MKKKVNTCTTQLPRLESVVNKVSPVVNDKVHKSSLHAIFVCLICYSRQDEKLKVFAFYLHKNLKVKLSDPIRFSVGSMKTIFHASVKKADH